MKRTAPLAVERRSAPRQEPTSPIWGQLLLEVDSAVRALSPRGMMVRVAAPPTVGATQVFVLTFESTTLRLKGVVKNVTPVLQTGPARYDVGVEFEELEASAREFLERFVESRT
ncbi:MAG TPA: PilZ domain-containing protein [Vicinamibacteria bacterium]|nr:PilZ domain-containing protein [Vicinamibacteria bacterium]